MLPRKTLSFSSLRVGSLSPVRALLLAGIGLMVSAGTASATTPALGGGGGVPEIDPGLVSSSLALLFGGVLILTDQCRRKLG